MNVSILELDRRSVWPNFQSIQLLCWHVLQHTDPLSRDQEAGIAVRDDLDCIPLGHVADGLRPNLSLCFRPTGGKRCGVLGVTDLVWVHDRNFTSAVVPFRKVT